MPKIIIINECRECNSCIWVAGKPRCFHDGIQKVEPSKENDYCMHPRCFTDGTKPFLDGCPLMDA